MIIQIRRTGNLYISQVVSIVSVWLVSLVAWHTYLSKLEWYCWWTKPAPVDMVDIFKYRMIYKALYIPGGAGFLPSTVVGAHLVISHRFLGYTVRHLGHAKLCHHRSSHTFHLRSGGRGNKKPATVWNTTGPCQSTQIGKKKKAEETKLVVVFF